MIKTIIAVNPSLWKEQKYYKENKKDKTNQQCNNCAYDITCTDSLGAAKR